MVRKSAIASILLGTALGLGLTVASAVDAPAALAQGKPAKTAYSKPFVTAAGPLQKAIETAVKDPAIAALTKQISDSRDPAQQATLRQQLDTQAGGLTALLSAAEAAATTPDDKATAGQFRLNVGVLMRDPAMQEAGLFGLVSSGKVPAESAGKIYYNLGILEYQAKKFGLARQHLQAAQQANYNDDPELGRIIADTLFREGKTAEGSAALKTAIDRMKAANQPVSDKYYLMGVSWASRAKDLGGIGEWGAQYVGAINTPKAWNDILVTLAVDAKYQKPEMLDVLRLMARTNSILDDRGYREYVDTADTRSLPGEVVKVLNAGVAAGKLRRNDAFVSQSLADANGRIAADRASLPGLAARAQRDAAGVLALATGDAYLSYGDLAKAIELYRLALTKGGIDRDRANTRLGIALADSGDLAGARQAFGQVSGARQPLARMWTAYVATKGG